MVRALIWTGAVAVLVCTSLLGGYLYYQQRAAAAIAEFSRHLPGGIQMAYDSLSADLDGRVTMHQVALMPAAGVGGATVETVTFHSPDAGYLFGAARTLSEGVFPQTGAITLKGMKLSLSPVNIPLIDSALADSLSAYDGVSELLMACGGHAPLSLQQLYEMGVPRLQADGQIRYQFKPTQHAVDLSLHVALQQLFSLQADILMDSDAPEMSAYMFEHYMGGLRQAKLSYQDDGYHRQRNRYCASLDDDIPEQYMKMHRDRVASRLRSLGWQIEPASVFAYQRVMSERGAFQLQLLPDGSVPVGQLQSQSLQDSWQILRPRLRLGREWLALDTLYQAPAASAIVASIQHQTEQNAPSAGANDEQRRKTREAIERAVKGGQHSVREKVYQSVDVSRIGEFIGHWVKLETYFGRKVHGTLKRIEGNTLYVDQYMEQGSAVYPIDKTKLARLQVLH